jgi:hypothetical protein
MNESKQASKRIMCRNDREREREGRGRGGVLGGSEECTKENLVAILTLCSTSMAPTSHKKKGRAPTQLFKQKAKASPTPPPPPKTNVFFFNVFSPTHFTSIG